MNRRLGLILVAILLIACSGCFLVVPDHGRHGDRDRGGHGDRDGGRHNGH